MARSIYTELPEFSRTKTYDLGGQKYTVTFVKEGNGFALHDAPDAVANHLLSGKFPAFSELTNEPVAPVEKSNVTNEPVAPVAPLVVAVEEAKTKAKAKA